MIFVQRLVTVDDPDFTVDNPNILVDGTYVPVIRDTTTKFWTGRQTSDLTADTTLITVDSDNSFSVLDTSWTMPEGWPCSALQGNPPSVADRQSAPSADDLLPQILALTPRGAAWGTDEAGNGKGASPVQRSFWRAIAMWAADLCTRDFALAVQVFPSAIDDTLPVWEGEFGLPDPCLSTPAGTEARVAAVRARFGAVGGSSPAYFICLAKSVGYDIAIEEPTQFAIDESEVVDGGGILETWFLIDDGEIDTADAVETWFLIDEGEIDDTPLEATIVSPSGPGTPLEASYILTANDLGTDELAGDLLEGFFQIDEGEIDETPLESAYQDPSGSLWKFWVVHVQTLGETWFRIDEGEIEVDPLEGFLPASDLECLFQRIAPPHTEVVFSYAAAA